MQQVERLIDSILGPVLGPVPAAETAATEPPPHALYRDLIDGVGASPALRLAVGRAWILVRTAHSAGLAYAPRWPVGIVPARLERLDGVMLRDLASLALRRHALAANHHLPRTILRAYPIRMIVGRPGLGLALDIDPDAGAALALLFFVLMVQGH